MHLNYIFSQRNQNVLFHIKELRKTPPLFQYFDDQTQLDLN